jgi:cell division protein FtsB
MPNKKGRIFDSCWIVVTEYDMTNKKELNHVFWWRRRVDTITGAALIIALVSLLIGVAAQLSLKEVVSQSERELKSLKADIEVNRAQIEEVDTRFIRTIRQMVSKDTFIESPFGVMYDLVDKVFVPPKTNENGLEVVIPTDKLIPNPAPKNR